MYDSPSPWSPALSPHPTPSLPGLNKSRDTCLSPLWHGWVGEPQKLCPSTFGGAAPLPHLQGFQEASDPMTEPQAPPLPGHVPPTLHLTLDPALSQEVQPTGTCPRPRPSGPAPTRSGCSPAPETSIPWVEALRSAGVPTATRGNCVWLISAPCHLS